MSRLSTNVEAVEGLRAYLLRMKMGGCWLVAISVLGCESNPPDLEGVGRPPNASASSDLAPVGEPDCDSVIERFRICSRNSHDMQVKTRNNMAIALANSSTRAEAIATCKETLEMLRGACPQPGDPPRPSQPLPPGSASASAGPRASGDVFVPTPMMSGILPPR